MKDDIGRTIDYLRISLTDRCNFRCKYCMPQEGVEMLRHSEILTLEEILRLAEISVALGVSKIRLTGGEPLVRRGLYSLLSRMSTIRGIDNISMTTNGYLLESMASELKKTGLNRLNISLDTLDREKFKKITRIDGLDQVLRGIDSAMDHGFDPIKINTVILKDINDNEVINMANFASERGLILRFIEQMPFNKTDVSGFVGAAQIIEILSRHFGEAQAVHNKKELIGHGSGPASLYSFGREKHIIGFVTAMTNHFCDGCNRLRITSDGKLKPCLLSNQEIDLKESLRDNSTDEEIKEILMSTIRSKPEKHNYLNKKSLNNTRGMSKIGG